MNNYVTLIPEHMTDNAQNIHVSFSVTPLGFQVDYWSGGLAEIINLQMSKIIQN
jgi:hypothetical protein